MAILKNTTISGTGAVPLPTGTTAQRPASPSAGMTRFNTDYKTVETYDGTSWINPSLGSTAATASASSVGIKALVPNAQTGWYWLKTGAGPRKYWIDMDYDGGGWVLVGSHPINVSIPNDVTYAQSTGYVTRASSPSYYGYTGTTGDPKTYSLLVGLSAWNDIVVANASGRNFVYYVAASQAALADTGTHTYRARWTWTGWAANYAWQGATTPVLEKGTYNPGLYSYHVASGFQWSTFDGGGNTCPTNYNNAPFWYGSCWSGNFWGGNGSGYANAAFWDSSGSDYHNYGGWYIK